MKKVTRIMLAVALMAAALATWAAVSAQEQQLQSYMRLLKGNPAAEREDVIRKNMSFTPSQADAFWPIYDKYAADMRKLSAQRSKLIETYLKNQPNMSDKMAKDLLTQWQGIERKRLDWKGNYYQQFAKVLPARTVARFYQIDGIVDRLADLALSSRMPLFK